MGSVVQIYGKVASKVGYSITFLWHATFANIYIDSYLGKIINIHVTYHSFICTSASPSPMSDKRNGKTLPFNASKITSFCKYKITSVGI